MTSIPRSGRRGPFTFAEYQLGQSIKGVRNPDYYHQGLPYLDGFTGIYADKQAVASLEGGESVGAATNQTRLRNLYPLGLAHTQLTAPRRLYRHGARGTLSTMAPP